MFFYMIKECQQISTKSKIWNTHKNQTNPILNEKIVYYNLKSSCSLNSWLVVVLAVERSHFTNRSKKMRFLPLLLLVTLRPSRGYGGCF